MSRAARRLRRAPRAGFSLIEAVVVLGITSVLLVLLFSVTAGATRSGFRLADRALATGDRAVGTEATRVLLRGLRLPERGRWETAFDGGPQALSAPIAPARATACTGAAPPAAVRLQLESGGGRTRITCATPGAAAVVVAEFAAPAASFAYALPGRPWTPRLGVPLPPARPGAAPATPTAAQPRLWVRLAADDGSFELIEAVDAPPRPGAAT